MKFFFDECISQHLTRALACLERVDGPDFPGRVTIEHIRQRYPNPRDPQRLDPNWIPVVVSEGYNIVTTDHAQRKRTGKHAIEAEALREAIGVWLPKGFVKSTPIWDQAYKLFKWWPAIKAEVRRASPGDHFDVSESGKVFKATLKTLH